MPGWLTRGVWGEMVNREKVCVKGEERVVGKTSEREETNLLTSLRWF